MDFRKHSGAWYVAAGLLSLGALAGSAQAAAITYSQLLFTGPVLNISFTGDALVSPTAAGSYTFSGEWCVNESCSSSISNSFTSLLRLTNLTLTCNSGGADCAPIDVTFEADNSASLGGSASIDLNLFGTGNATGYARVCIASQESICPSDLTGNQSATVFFEGDVTGTNSFNASIATGFVLLGIFHLDGLANGQSVTLANSFDVGAAAFQGSQVGVPEPASLLLLGAGLVCLIGWRRK